jgi:hypothetical protein
VALFVAVGGGVIVAVTVELNDDDCVRVGGGVTVAVRDEEASEDRDADSDVDSDADCDVDGVAADTVALRRRLAVCVLALVIVLVSTAPPGCNNMRHTTSSKIIRRFSCRATHVRCTDDMAVS